MLKPGTIFCPYCCRTHTIPFYIGNTDVGVELHYKGDQYGIVEKQIPDPSDPTLGLRAPDTPRGIELISPEHTAHAGLPAWVEVRIPGQSTSVRMRRACPHCLRRNDRANLGALPTLIVGMVGVTSSGKSAFLNSIAYPSHQAAVNDEGFPYTIDIDPLPLKSGLAAATPRMGRGMTKLLTIIRRSTNTPICHVLLLDVSGELYGEAHGENSFDQSDKYREFSMKDTTSLDELTNILSGTDGYPGVDAVIFTDSIPGSVPETKASLQFGAASVMNQCKLLNSKFNSLPMAYVFTHLDYYNIKTFPTYQVSPRQSIPLASEMIFRNGRYHPSALIERIYVEDTIARRLDGFVPSNRNKPLTKGFLIQSCSCENVPEIGLVENYTHSINVMDPLLWVLNKLQVFPLILD